MAAGRFATALACRFALSRHVACNSGVLLFPGFRVLFLDHLRSLEYFTIRRDEPAIDLAQMSGLPRMRLDLDFRRFPLCEDTHAVFFHHRIVDCVIRFMGSLALLRRRNHLCGLLRSRDCRSSLDRDWDTLAQTSFGEGLAKGIRAGSGNLLRRTRTRPSQHALEPGAEYFGLGLHLDLLLANEEIV